MAETKTGGKRIMQIRGETMIFANEKGGYSTTVSNKKPDGTYDNMYIAVNFKKDIEVENQTKIDITNGFLSFYKTREGLPKPKIVVMNFEIKGKKEEAVNTNNNFEISQDDDLPF